MPGILTRDDIVDGLRELVSRLRKARRTATIQIVGGAAIALTIDEDRPATADIDGPITPLADVAEVAALIAAERNWPVGWVNNKAAMFLPSGLGRSPEWVTLYDRDGIVIQAASPAMLLAMKLRAFERRGLRDAGDVALLLSVLSIRSADEAEDLLNQFFPGEDLSPRTYARVEQLLAAASPGAPVLPRTPDFS